ASSGLLGRFAGGLFVFEPDQLSEFVVAGEAAAVLADEPEDVGQAPGRLVALLARHLGRSSRLLGLLKCDRALLLEPGSLLACRLGLSQCFVAPLPGLVALFHEPSPSGSVRHWGVASSPSLSCRMKVIPDRSSPAALDRLTGAQQRLAFVLGQPLD